MKLSAEQFAELAASFDARQSTTTHERRRAARLDLTARVKIIPIVSGKRLAPTQIMVCNFSARGLSFIYEQPMERGRQFITELPRKSGGVLEMLCTVVHSDPVGSNAYRMGAEFTCTVPGAQSAGTSQGDTEEMKRIRESMLG